MNKYQAVWGWFLSLAESQRKMFLSTLKIMKDMEWKEFEDFVNEKLNSDWPKVYGLAETLAGKGDWPEIGKVEQVQSISNEETEDVEQLKSDPETASDDNVGDKDQGEDTPKEPSGLSQVWNKYSGPIVVGMGIIFAILVIMVAIALTVSIVNSSRSVKAEEPVVTSTAVPTIVVSATVEEAEVVETEAEQELVEEPQIMVPSDVVGLNPITRDSGYEVFTTVSRTGTFEPQWPDGIDQTSVGYSNPEEYPDGRSFMTRSQANEGEIMAFVAKCVQIGEGKKVCQSKDAGAIVGLVIGHDEGEYPVKLWDAEYKTLTFHGGSIDEWRAFIHELGTFISANKDGKPVEILGPIN